MLFLEKNNTMPKHKHRADFQPDKPRVPKANKIQKCVGEESKDQKERDTASINASASASISVDEVTLDMLEDKITPQTFTAIKDMGFTSLTEIQAKAIPHLLVGRDVNGAAKTGSGKTLAFLIPVVELLSKQGFTCESGTGCIILSPTRELALQTQTVLTQLVKYHTKLTHGLVIGGVKKDLDSANILSGLNIIVATPGRLLDQLQSLEGFHYSNLKILVIDEADRLLDMGFERQMRTIVSILPKNRQTALFTATPTTKTEDLVKLSFRSNPVYIGVDDDKKSATVHGLQQGYLICPIEKRFVVLFNFLKRNRKKKVMVFFKTFKSVKFYDLLLNQIGLPVFSIYGRMKQNKRSNIFSGFIKADHQILLCTDVAARGLDIPSVDWIVQFDPPDDHTEYIHRVGRTARGEGKTGQALIFLLPSEKEFLFLLKQAKVSVNEFEFDFDSVVDITDQIIEEVAHSAELTKAAKAAFKGYIRGYTSSSLKHIFDIHKLDAIKIGLSFGLPNPPHFAMTKKKKGKKK